MLWQMMFGRHTRGDVYSETTMGMVGVQVPVLMRSCARCGGIVFLTVRCSVACDTAVGDGTQQWQSNSSSGNTRYIYTQDTCLAGVSYATE